jgi:hypothetical protein
LVVTLVLSINYGALCAMAHNLSAQRLVRNAREKSVALP